MNRYESIHLPHELEPLVPVLAKLYARILAEQARYRVDTEPFERAVKAPPTRRLLLRIPEVAQALSISRSRAYVLIRAGEIPVVRIGRSVRVSTDALQGWIRANSSTL